MIGGAFPASGPTSSRRFVFAGGSVLVVLLVLYGALLVGGVDPWLALRALGSGSFGSWYALTSGTLVRATPLIVSGLAIAVAFRAGVFNIGVEGQLLAGAAAAAWVGVTQSTHLGPLTWPMELVVGAAAGCFWASVAAVLRARFRVLEVISTLLLNFIALHVVAFLVRGPLQEHLHVYPQSETLPIQARLPYLIAGSRLHVGFVIAVGVGVSLWWALRSTEVGYRLRVVGANPHAAFSAGRINIGRETTRALLVSGALGGLAGAIQLAGVTFALYEDLSPGYGYTAIAVALLGRLEPELVVLSGILFGALESGATAMQREAGAPSVLASVIEAMIVLYLVGLGGSRVFAGEVTAVAQSSPAS